MHEFYFFKRAKRKKDLFILRETRVSFQKSTFYKNVFDDGFTQRSQLRKAFKIFLICPIVRWHSILAKKKKK